MAYPVSQVYREHRFEVILALSMAVLGLSSIFLPNPPSGALDTQISQLLYYVWQWGISLSGAVIIGALFSRPWAARRLPPARGEKTMATLRGIEAAACVTMASAMVAFVVVILSRSLTGTAVVSFVFLAIAWAFLGQARDLMKENRDRLAQLHHVNVPSK